MHCGVADCNKNHDPYEVFAIPCVKDGRLNGFMYLPLCVARNLPPAEPLMVQRTAQRPPKAQV